MCDFTRYGTPTEDWKRVEAELPSPPLNQSLEDLKRNTNLGRETLAKSEMQELSSKVSLQDFSITARDGYTLEARCYRPSAIPHDQKLPIYLHLHGGGFLFGTLSSEDAICSRIAINTEVAVLNVNYRHTPEYVYPTAWNDAEDALIWICKNSARFYGDLGRIVLGGISAGAWLTAALTQTVVRSGLRISPPPKILGQVLMIPCVVFSACYESQLRQMRDPSISSYRQAANAPILNAERKKLFNSLLKVENPDPKDKRLNPGHIEPEEAKRLPPTTLGIAGNDPLRDEGILYGRLLAENGVPVSINVFSGMPHGFRRYGEKLPLSKEWDKVLENGIRWALTRPSGPTEFEIQAY